MMTRRLFGVLVLGAVLVALPVSGFAGEEPWAWRDVSIPANAAIHYAVHEGDRWIEVTRGSLVVYDPVLAPTKAPHVLRPGDRHFIAAREPHGLLVGPTGVSFHATGRTKPGEPLTICGGAY
jgi:hypothetical protein